MKKELTFEEIDEALEYFPETGLFRWKVRRQGRAKFGTWFAGTTDKARYRKIMINGRFYLSHRLAWLISYKVRPASDIDHINGERADNRLINLREASKSENKLNTRTPLHNTSGVKGVHWDAARKKWVAQVRTFGKVLNLGGFNDIADANAVAKAAREKYHGEFCNHGQHPSSPESL